MRIRRRRRASAWGRLLLTALLLAPAAGPAAGEEAPVLHRLYYGTISTYPLSLLWPVPDVIWIKLVQKE